MMRCLFLLLFCFCNFKPYAQDCESLIILNGIDEYSQKEKSRGSVLGKPIEAQIWVDKIGDIVYCNLSLQDTNLNIRLHQEHRNASVFLNFLGQKTIICHYTSGSLKSTINIAINKNPENDTSIMLRQKDTTIPLKTYSQFLEALYKDTLLYAMVAYPNPNYQNDKLRFLDMITIFIPRAEAVKFQRSLVCIFKAIQ